MANVPPSASPPVATASPPRASPPPPPPPPQPPAAPVYSPDAPRPSLSSPPPSAPGPSNGSSSLPPTPPPLSPPPPPPPPPVAVPPSPPPSSPPPPAGAPPSTKSPPPPPFISPPPPSDPPKVSPPPPPTPVEPTESSSPPPPTPIQAPKSSPPPPTSRLSPPPPPNNPATASPLPASSSPPTVSPPPSGRTAPPTSPPSTSPPPPTSEQAAPPLSSALSPESPTPTSPTNADSPTPIHKSAEISPPVEKDSGIGTGDTVGIGIGVGILIVIFIGLAIWYTNRRRRKPSRFSSGHIIPTSISTFPASDSSVVKIPSSAPLNGSSSGSELFYFPNEPPGGLGNSRLCFTYDDLVKATDGFSAESFLGEGGFGSVYKGRLQDGREVAVKQLKVGAKQGEREFKAEVDIISRIHHRHLVSLVGYCIAEDRKLLVYDYVPNNTLYFHLHGEGRPVLDWAIRVKVAVGAARGLAYLHEDCHPRIIHRDIKSSNILLDNNFEARVSDFGLAKLALDAHTHITTRVMGTFGYMAPEYALSGKLTEKSDVYSFGVVLLELITGRMPVDTSQPLGDEGLVEWARPLMSHALDHEEFEGLADPTLEGNYVKSQMFAMIEAAAACVRHSAAKRPRLRQIVRAFDSFAASDLTNGMRLGESEVFNSAQQSLEIREFQRMQFGSQGSSTEYFTQPTMTSRTLTS